MILSVLKPFMTFSVLCDCNIYCDILYLHYILLLNKEKETETQK